MTLMQTAWAATPADQNFDALLAGDRGSNSVTIADIIYTNNDAIYIKVVTDGDIASLADKALGYRSFGPGTSTLVSFKTSDGDEFKLNGFAVSRGFGSNNLTISGFRDNVSVVSTSYNLSAVNFGTFDVSANSSWENIDEVRISGVDLDIDIDDLDFSPKVLPTPTITNATYNASTGAIVVTGTNFTSKAGAANDIDASKLTFTGEGGATYTLSDTSDVDISSASTATLTLSATDKAAINSQITNKNGTASTGGTTYNLAAADDWNAAVTAGNTADLTSNVITASGVPTPTITNATYNANTAVLVVTGTGLSKRAGATNDIVANKFTLYGEAGTSYTLTDTSNVEITSGTSFSLTLSATDKASLNLIVNRNGGVSTDISTYNFNAAEDWAAGAGPAVTVADASNVFTASNVSVPTITSALYDVSTGIATVSGSGFTRSGSGGTNDIIANKFTLTGQAGATYTLTDTANVEITNGTSFSLTLSATDKSSVDSLLNKNGTQSNDVTTYNLAAAEDWSAGSDSAVTVADLTANGITVSNAVTPVTVPGAPTVDTVTAGNGQAIIAFSAPGSNGGSAITGYTVTSSPGTFTGSWTSSPITVAGLTNGTAYTFAVTATNAVGTGSASGASNSVTPKATQTITFGNPGAQTFGTTPTLSATSTSSLVPTFTSSTTGVCTITSGGDLTFVTAGSCTINADQAGNGSYLAGTTVAQSFTVNAVVPGAPTAATATAGDTQASIAFTAPASNGGVAITSYTVTSSPGGLTGSGAGSPMTVTGLTNGVAYTFTVTATSSGIGTGAASGASNSITPAAVQTITFANPGAQNFGTTPTLTATASSSLTPTFTSSTTGICTVTTGGALTFVAAGTCSIDADQTGNSSYSAAPTVTRSFTVNAVVPGVPTAATATAGDTQASVAFSAPVFTGGATITSYTVTASPGGLTGAGAGSPINVSGLTNGLAYTFTVRATNGSGTGSVSTASSAITPAATQTITFANPGAQNFGTSPTLTASSDSALSPTFTSSTAGVCTITSGGVLTFVSVGTCTINTNQAGNGSYLAAAQVSRSFSINAIVAGSPSIGTATAGDTAASVAFSAPASNGGAAITGYTVTSSPGGLTGAGAGSPIAMTGLTNGVAYTFSVTATNSVGTGSASSASNSITPQATQTITFANPGAQNVDTSPTLTASASSGLTPSFSSATSSVCTITTGGVLSFVMPGTCTVNVDQAGNAAFSAAVQVSETFTVNAVAANAPTISSATAGDSEATVSFTAPSNTGGSAITGYTVTSSPGGLTATGSASPLTVTGLTNGTAYTFSVTATNSAGASAASSASNSVTPIGPQTITFANPGAQNVDTSPTLTASASSGLTPSFSSATSSVCTITSGGVLSFVMPGTCTVNVDQAGNAAFSAAAQVSETFTVNAVAANAPTISSAAAGDSEATVSFTAPSNTGGSAITAYTVTSSPGGLTATGSASPLTVTGLTNGTAYTFSVTATNSSGASAASSASNSVTPIGPQTITFANPGAQNVDTSPTLTASASSGLTPSFSSATSSVCTITSGGVLSFVMPGTCTVNVDQAGNAAFSAAVQVSETFTVNAVAANAPTISSATAGDSEATVSFTAPSNTGGSAITGYTVTSSPGGLTATGSASPLTVTGLTNGTAYTFSVTATNSAGVSAASGNSNVVIPNGAPTINGSPTLTVAQDIPYQFTPSAADNVGDTLTFSIVNKPIWTTFNSVTGMLSGTPTNQDVGETTGIVISVSDGSFSASLPVFNLTVTNVNDAPVFSSSGVTVATQDVAYSYTVSATDSDVGDVLTYSSVTIPAWLSFDASTAILSGTPGNSDVGSHAVTLKVTDSDGLTADQSFSITVINVNDAPIAVSSIVTVDEDSSVMITLSANDSDNDLLSYEVVTMPTSGTLEKNGTVWLYTPEKDFNGTDVISFIAKDAELSSEPAAVTINVTSINDEPVAVDDTFTVVGVESNIYALAVLANDIDVDGDVLTIDGAAADIGTVAITAEGLSFTAPEAYVGPVALRYTITDGNQGRATAKVNLLIDGIASDSQPVITLPSDIDINATGLFTRVKLGVAKAVDRNGQSLPVSLINKNVVFAPGVSLVYWQATDAEGNTAIKAQKINVYPLVSFGKDQTVAEGNEVAITVHLNGTAPVYPVIVPFTVSGSADSSDHDLVDGVVEITSGQTAQFNFNTFEDGDNEVDESVTISLDSSVNVGSKNKSNILISEVNIAPKIGLKITQAGNEQLIVAQNGGDVSINVNLTDANQQDSLTSEWQSGAVDIQPSDTGVYLSPIDLEPGVYPISLTVTDNGIPQLSTTETVNLVVYAILPVLSGDDSDGDLIPDNQEGFTDTDLDGIPNYLDAIDSCNVLQETKTSQTRFLMEGEAGVCLRLGQSALEQNAFGSKIEINIIPEDMEAINIGGVFDFDVSDLPVPGQSVKLVLPQILPIAINSIYRKYHSEKGWDTFVTDTNNTISSSAGELGYCPPPGSVEYTEGLTEGHWCVQLTIEDGGANDSDGRINGTVVDPGGVAVLLNGNHFPVANVDNASMSLNQSLDIDVLANDTDEDGDSLSVQSVTSDFGDVSVLANQQISYTPEVDFIGTDILSYSISDGQGGTSTSQVTITVIANSPPTTVDDNAETDDRTSLLLNVLINDSDIDGDSLTLISGSALEGLVTVEANQLRYTPKLGFEGIDTVSYLISDGAGGEAMGQVFITINAYQDVIVKNKSSGGSLSLYGLVLLIFGGLLRRAKWLTVSSVVLASVITQANAAEANRWYLDGFVGQAYADSKLAHRQTDTEITDVNDDDTAFGLSAGYQWNTFIAVELGYSDFGNGSAQLSGSTLTPEAYHQELKSVTPILAEGMTLGLRFTVVEHEDWRFEVPVGLFRWEADVVSDMNNSRLMTELDGTDWYIGMQFHYQMTKSWSLGIGYQYIDLEPNDILTGQFSLRYHF
ncbi:Ig-like domain-containing protein [Shewanella sp. MF05960]|uniref:Ig-like domain-containing protein n=1 Tax=Shewanella sp. MF05960 TaxID=3434874 RepID=UPI003D79B424